MNKFNILTGIVGVIATFTGYLFFSNQVNDVISVGTELPDAPALFETSLAAPITATADSFTLTSNTVRGGGSISGYNCFTIDEGSAQAEFVCGTASSTSVTNVTRGISPSDGTSAVASLQVAHRRGASVKITDFPIIQILRNQNNGEATFENVLRYAGSVVPTGASDLADVGYVLSVVNGGAVTFDALVVAGRAGETVATGTLVYFNSTDQEWYKVNANSTSTFQDTAVGLTQGSGVNAGAIGGGGVLLKGRDDTQTGLTAGTTYYASTTAGLLGKTATSQPIGKADSSGVLYFDPLMIGTPKLGYNNIFTGSNTFTGTTTFTGPVFGTASATIRVYTATTTWTKPSNLRYAVVEVIGAGGGGGGAQDATLAIGVGGGGGAYAKVFIPASQLPSTVVAIAGSGGSGGSATTGGVGTASIFTGFATSTGGLGGGESTNSVTVSSLGGTATINSSVLGITMSGGLGGGVYTTNISGNGGSSFYGNGPFGITGDSNGINATSTDYGAGGSGARDTNNSANVGGNGASGAVIVTEYY